MDRGRESERPYRVVAIGGGDGLHALVRGLVADRAEVTAILTVADDGGSSGRLRKEFDIPPPGDIRRCLVALSQADPLIGELFEYRFTDAYLKGHSFGNLFIAVLTQLSGDFRQAIERARELLGASGRVIPATDRKVVLVAEHRDGSKSTGQQAIAQSGKPIAAIRLVPRPPSVSEEIREALAQADLICVGPGSLYTRIAPNLLVPGMVEAINASKAPVVWVANLMTQPGETDGYSAADHLRVFQEFRPALRIDRILVPSEAPGEAQRELYAGSGAEFVDYEGRLGPRAPEVVARPFIASGDKVRHDPRQLAAALLGLLGDRQRSLEAAD
ncbi:MAG: uridine diphosphate-N-acetylglucosamine-binding protein YvcK [Planctomycetota bacterium]